MAFDTVSVGRCYSMAEAMMIRSLLGARGIEAIIPGMGAGALALAANYGFSSQVLVLREHAEEAAALLVELREGQGESSLAEAQEGEPPLDADGDGGHELFPEEPEVSSVLTAADPLEQAARRRRVAATIGIGLFLPVGAGHLLNGAPLRALGLALLQIVALRSLVDGNPLAGLVVGAVLLTDLIGGSMLAWQRRTLPVARTITGNSGPRRTLPVARTITGNPGPREPLGP